MSWSHWIEMELGKVTGYDELLELVCRDFKLRAKSKKRVIVDRRQYVAMWYRKNSWKFSRYNNLTKVSKQIGVKDHSGVIHLSNHRDVSNRQKEYDKNVKCLVDYIGIY